MHVHVALSLVLCATAAVVEAFAGAHLSARIFYLKNATPPVAAQVTLLGSVSFQNSFLSPTVSLHAGYRSSTSSLAVWQENFV